jgi:hypothetical protein
MRAGLLAVSLVALLSSNALSLIDIYEVRCDHPSHGHRWSHVVDPGVDACIELAAHRRDFPKHKPYVVLHPDEGPGDNLPVRCPAISDIKQACIDRARREFDRALSYRHPWMPTELYQAVLFASRLFETRETGCYHVELGD